MKAALGVRITLLTFIAQVLYFNGRRVKLRWYPSYLEDDEDSAVKVFIRKDLARYNPLRSKVRTFLDRIKEINDLEPFFASKQIYPLGNGLYEMRIPKQARGGVVRIYDYKGRPK